MSETRSVILNATLELISTRGLHDTPMSKIAKHAEISVGSIYTHFENKDDLVEQLYREIKIELANKLIEDVDFGADTRTIFRKVWMNVAQFYMEEKHKTDFLEHYETTPMAKKVYEEKFMVITNPFMDYVLEAKEKGIIRNFDFQVLGSLMFEVVVSLARKHVRGEIDLTESLLEQTFEACWTGIKAP